MLEIHRQSVFLVIALKYVFEVHRIRVSITCSVQDFNHLTVLSERRSGKKSLHALLQKYFGYHYFLTVIFRLLIDRHVSIA